MAHDTIITCITLHSAPILRNPISNIRNNTLIGKFKAILQIIDTLVNRRFNGNEVLIIIICIYVKIKTP